MESEDLIQCLNLKGVDFKEISEKEAQHFLEDHNYYVKVSSYRHNYDKDEEGLYIDLDFWHLKELSTIDMHLKFLILKACLNIEHSLRVNLLNDIEKEKIDEIELVENFVKYLKNKDIDLMREINNRRKDQYVGNLLSKYEHPNYPIWILLEVISFGSLVKLIEYYCTNYNGDFADIELLYRVRNIRNAAAHSNCLIHNLKDRDSYYIDTIYKYLANNIKNYRNREIKEFLRNTFIHDFSCLILALDLYIKSDEIKHYRLKEFDEFLNNRVSRNKDHFLKNKYIVESYKFIKNILDFFES